MQIKSYYAKNIIYKKELKQGENQYYKTIVQIKIAVNNPGYAVINVFIKDKSLIISIALQKTLI